MFIFKHFVYISWKSEGFLKNEVTKPETKLQRQDWTGTCYASCRGRTSCDM